MNFVYAPSILGVVGIDASMNLAVFSASIDLMAVKATETHAELKFTLLGIVNMEKSRSISRGKPLQIIETLRSPVLGWELNPQPLASVTRR